MSLWLDMGVVGRAVCTSLIPAAAMWFGSACIFCVKEVSAKFQGCMQNFSAGIIIAAVAGELFPLLTSGPYNRHEGEEPPHPTSGGTVGMVVGFLVALLVFYLLEFLMGKLEGDEEGGEDIVSAVNPDGTELVATKQRYMEMPDEKIHLCDADYKASIQEAVQDLQQLAEHLEEHGMRSPPVRHSLDKHIHQMEHQLNGLRSTIRGDPAHMSLECVEKVKVSLASLKGQATKMGRSDIGKHELLHEIDEFEKMIEEAHALYEDWRAPSVYRRWSFMKEPPANAKLPERLPASLILAICLDTFVDGFLIALTFTASEEAGFVMAGATMIEMGFLGLTFAAQLRSVSRSRAKIFPIIFGTPILMPLGALAGALLASVVVEYSSVFIGFIAFCTVALLFLVTQELILEAHETGDDWYVHIWLFLGVMVPLIVTRHVG